VINFGEMSEAEARDGWPELMAIVEHLVKPYRNTLKDVGIDKQRKRYWWRYGSLSSTLYRATAGLPRVLANSSKASPWHAIAVLPNGLVYSQNLNVFALPTMAAFCALQSRVHEAWTRFFGTTLKDDLTYTISDCFRTFPFPENFEADTTLETTGAAYHTFRADVMVERNEGLTKIYNRFHTRSEKAPDIVRLRALHADMDFAVLSAYGWSDLADHATLDFFEQHAAEDKNPKNRLDWPAAFKDEVLARLLALNAERAADERAAGLTAPAAEEEDGMEEDSEAA
jgi:hypothetical protein